MLSQHRFTLLASAAALAVALLVARAALRGGAGPSVAPGTCEATWSVSLGTRPDARPRALIAAGDDVWAAVSLGDEVQLLRVRDGRRHQSVITARAAPDAVRGWFADAAGVHLALAEGSAVRVLTPSAPERVVPASEVPAPQRDLRELARAVAGAGALALGGAALAQGAVALWTTRDGDVTTLRYRLMNPPGRAAAAAGTLGQLLANPDASVAAAMAAAQAGPREAVMALATSHGPRLFHLRCGAAP